MKKKFLNIVISLSIFGGCSNPSFAQIIAHVAGGYDSKPNPTLSFGIGAKIKALYATFDLRPDMNRKQAYSGNNYLGGNVGFDVVSLFNNESYWQLIPEVGYYNHKVNNENKQLNSNVFMGAVKVMRQIGAGEIPQYELEYTVNAFIEPASFEKSYQIMAGLLFTL